MPWWRNIISSHTWDALLEFLVALILLYGSVLTSLHMIDGLEELYLCPVFWSISCIAIMACDIGIYCSDEKRFVIVIHWMRKSCLLGSGALH